IGFRTLRDGIAGRGDGGRSPARHRPGRARPAEQPSPLCRGALRRPGRRRPRHRAAVGRMGPPLGGGGAVVGPVNPTRTPSPRRAFGLALTVLGVVVLLAGWVRLRAAEVVVAWAGASGTPFVADQLSYVASGGVGGLFLLALGLALLMSADHHDEWRKLDAIERALTEPGPELQPAPPARPESGRAAE